MKLKRLLVLFVGVLVATSVFEKVAAGDITGCSIKYSTKRTPSPTVVDLSKLDKYMTIRDDHTVDFNFKRALLNLESPRVIYFGLKAEKLINKMIHELKTNGKISQDTINEIEKLFGPSFRYPLLRLEACGGGFSNPHPCPRRVYSSMRWETLEEVKRYLESHGFHVVPRYAVYSDQMYGRDYAKVVCAYGCCNGPFRHEAVIVQKDGKWTYYSQTPEPNPEIFSYDAPAWWWDAYVAWWHLRYC